MELPLPDDVLADILRRLAPYDHHRSRQVCSSWRAIVHDRHKHLLPLPLAGIFVVTYGPLPIRYFAPRSSSSSTSSSSPITRIISGEFDYVDTPADADDAVQIQQHCNGLLLLEQWCRRGDHDYFCVNTVLNPATRQWARLPPSPGASTDDEQEDKLLVFDPAVSPHHYQVFSIKSLPFYPYSDAVDAATWRLEWPPSPYLVRVFSSTTRRWEEKELIREGDAAGIIHDMISLSYPYEHHYTVYRQGVLYVHQHSFLMRISLSNHRYQVIKLPGEEEGHHIRSSEKGVYCAWVYDRHMDVFRLCVWFLEESSSSSCHHQMKWVLKHDIKLEPLVAKSPPLLKHSDDDTTMPWSIQYANDDDDSGRISELPPVLSPPPISMLGFHPYKEIMFLHIPSGRVVACHLSNYVQD